jgi:hypothetical protein
MAVEFPEPSPQRIAWLSPTLANDLLDCGYRVAWRMDIHSRTLNRPSTYSELGVVAHAVMEEATRGSLVSDSNGDPRDAAMAAWDTHLERAHAELISAWKPAVPPNPDDWPGYHLTRARIIRRAVRQMTPNMPTDTKHSAPLLVERELRDDASGLRGRPDRVAGPRNERRIVDLKTGLRQGEATPHQRRQLMLYAHLVELVTGDRVSEIAIEDASGQIWAEPLERDEVQAMVQELQRVRALYETARDDGDLASTAVPSGDVCRWCPFRITCGPYWAALNSTWDHGSALGTIERSLPAAEGSILEMNIDSPTDSAGPGWIISMAPAEIAIAGSLVAITGAESTGTDRHLRWRWSTLSMQLS